MTVRPAITEKLKTALELVSGLRGPKDLHAVRFRDLPNIETGGVNRAAVRDETVRVIKQLPVDLDDAKPGTVGHGVAQAIAEADAAGVAAAEALLEAETVSTSLENLTQGFTGTLTDIGDSITDVETAVASVRADAEASIASLNGSGVLRPPARRWTANASGATSPPALRDAIPEAWFVYDDPTFTDCAELPAGATTEIGPAYPAEFEAGRLYKITARLRTVSDGTTSGVKVAFGASTWSGNTAADLNAQVTAANLLAVADGATILSAYVSTDQAALDEVDDIFGGVTTLRLAGSDSADKAYFHIRQNQGGTTDGQIRLRSFIVQDVTEAQTVARLIRTELTTAIDGVSSNLAVNYYSAASVDAAISAVQTDLRAEFAGFSNALSVGDFSEGQGEWEPAKSSIVTSTTPALPSSITHALEIEDNRVFDGALRAASDMGERILRFAGWVLTSASSYDAYVGIHTQRADGTTSDYTQVKVRNAGLGTWAQFSADITLPADVAQWRPYVGSSSAAAVSGQDIFFAQLFLRDVSGVEGLRAELHADYYTSAEADSAIAASRLALKSELEGPAGSIGQINANLTNNYYSKTQADSAIAAREAILNASIENLRGQVPGFYVPMDTLDGLFSHPGGTLTGPAGAGFAQTVQVIERGVVRNFTYGSNGDISVKIPLETAQRFASRRIKISLLIRAADYSTASTVSIGYLANNAGHSGEMIEAVPAAWGWVNFYYNVPATNAAQHDYIGLWPGPVGGSKRIYIAALTVQVAAEAEDLPEVNDLSARLVNIEGVKTTGGTAFGSMMQQLSVAANGKIAGIDNFGAAMANLKGKAEATYVLRAKAGGQSAGLKLVAWEDADDPGGSAILLDAEDVIAKGTISANQFAAGVSNNILENSDFTQGLWHVRKVGANTIGGSASVSLREPPISYTGLDYPTLMLLASTGASTNGWADAVFAKQDKNGNSSNGYAIKDNTWYEAQIRVVSFRAKGTLRVHWYDASGDFLAADIVADIVPVNGPSNNPNKWSRVGGLVKSPAGAAFAELRARIAEVESAPDARLYLHQPLLGETVEDARLSPYSSGKTTLITERGIITRGIKAYHLESAIVDSDHVNTTSFSAAGLSLFGGTLKSSSPPFVAGSTGWRIQNNGNAEFNDVIIRRQLQEATGTVFFPEFSCAGTPSLTNDYTTWVLATGEPLTEWAGADHTYIALVEQNTPSSVLGKPGTPPNVYWGWHATVMPLTKWSGNQTIRLKIDYWSRNVVTQPAGSLTWKLYKVT